MSDYLKTTLIGLFVFLALSATIFVVLFMEPKVGDGKTLLHVRFSNVSGISIGTRVTLAGKPIGEVVAIAVVKNARSEITDPLGRVYYYELTLKVDSSVQVFNTDEMAIRTTGLLGEKSIAIIPKAPKKGQEVKNITHQIIYADSIDPLESAFNKISSLSEKIESAVSNFDQWFTENHEELNNAVKSFGDAMAEIDLLLESAQKENIVASLKEAMTTFSDNMKVIHELLAEVQEDQMLAKVDTILDNFVETSKSFSSDGKDILSNVSQITKNIASGKGTIGKLVQNDDLYLRITSIMSKVDTLMNDVNHYGLLFQYDKGWQRIRTKRANLLEALNTPKEFKQYFETELDAINTSLSRVSILLEKADSSDKKKIILESVPFQRDFSELLKRVESLEDSVKLYNEQVIDVINQE